MISLLMPKEADTDIHIYTEYLKERIYGMLTLIAVSAGLLLAVDRITVMQASGTILATVTGLWAASLLASYAAWRVVHDVTMPKYRLWHEFVIHRALLLAAVPSIALFGLAGAHIIDLETALIADIAINAFSLAATFARAAKTKHNSALTAALLTAVQIVIVLGIIWVKASAK